MLSANFRLFRAVVQKLSKDPAPNLTIDASSRILINLQRNTNFDIAKVVRSKYGMESILTQVGVFLNFALTENTIRGTA